VEAPDEVAALQAAAELLQVRSTDIPRLIVRRVQQTRELPAPVCRWFTEGFDTRDLKETMAPPQELAA
jgi:hypothetical protein